MRKQLEQIFGNCKFTHKCVCNSKSSFETIEEKQFFIFDDGINEVPVKLVAVSEDYHLTVNNNLQHEIYLVKTDKCLLADDTQKCDCILFDDKQLFLAELKASSTGTRGTKRRKAKEQLIATIQLFNIKNIDRSNYKTFAIIAFKSIQPKIINTANNSDKATFFSLYDVHLIESNVISF
jgi:hypothetical protein